MMVRTVPDLDPPRSPTVESESHSKGGPAILRGLFVLMTSLVLASVGYAMWIVVTFWDRVGV